MNAKHDEFLDAAAGLGRRLVRDALWSGEHCNWLGDSMEFVDNAWTVVHRALGVDLYGGTSGVALFLGALFRLTGERLFKTTAQRALAHALARADDISPPNRISFYSGWLGIAYAAVQVAEAIGEEPFVERAYDMAVQAASMADETALDVIGGAAGAIPALISLHYRDRRADLLPLAIRLGEQLVLQARPSENGWSWNTMPGQTQRDLTGMSHGAAGIAWALLELYGATGDAAFRDAAEQGFAYERGWFSDEHGNWPDFRHPGAQAAVDTPSYGVAWCHGAPGIGLTRIRGYELTQSASLKAEAEAALRTTSRILSHPGYAAQADFTLCHGRAGNAELLIYAGEAIGDEPARHAAEAIGRFGLVNFARNNLPWPCGVPGGGETPNLMLGLAGIGYFFLRLYDPSRTPSILIVHPPR